MIGLVLTNSPAKGVNLKRVSWVRIPFCPPYTSNINDLGTAANFSGGPFVRALCRTLHEHARDSGKNLTS